MPYLRTLGNIERYLNQLETSSFGTQDERDVVKVSLMHYYFMSSISKNLELYEGNLDDDAIQVLGCYKNLLRSLNDIILHRKTRILNKQINLFTTNMDIFLDKALEDLKLEVNDGFVGRINPYFTLSNFHKSVFKTSSHYDNVSELPLFNLFKVHGSVTWKMKDETDIAYNHGLGVLREMRNVQFKKGQLLDLNTPPEEDGTETHPFKSIEALIKEAKGIEIVDAHRTFNELYEKLIIVNPTREKFKFTTLNYVYYELLRMFSNELEKENNVLFVAGFSFSDEHIREIILRSLNSNPTSLVCIFAYDSISEELIKQNLRLKDNPLKYGNIIFVQRAKKESESDAEIEFDLGNISINYFSALAKRLVKKESSVA